MSEEPVDTPSLPSGWVWASLGDLASDAPNSVTDGPFGSKLKTAHYTEDGPRVVRLQNIGDGEFVDARAHVSPEHFRDLAKHAVKPGDILIAMLGENLPRACAAPCDLGPAIVKADCAKFTPHPSGPSQRYLMYALNSPVIRRNAVVHGVGRPRLNLSEIKAISIPLAPRPEQDRIVAEIEKQFTRLDAAIAALKRVQANLKRYRAAVLKAAVEGDLTPGASAEHWKVETVEDLAEKTVDCSHSTPQFGPSGRACLDTNTMRPGVLMLSRLRYVDESTYQARTRRLVPQEGDVVFAREGTVGTAVVLPPEPPVCLGQRVMLIRPLPHVRGAYLQYALMSPKIKTQYAQKLLGSTVPHLNVGDVKKLLVLVPKVEIQDRIVQVIDEHWSLAAAAEEGLESTLLRMGRFRQTILNLAFGGRIVPQDPTDEPASMLLNRIRSERVLPAKHHRIIRGASSKRGSPAAVETLSQDQ